MSDKISIIGIQAHGYHGLLEDERKNGQLFVVDVEVELDLSKAGKSDDIKKSVDYNALAILIHGEITGPAVNLIESLAYRIGIKALDSFKEIDEIKVTVHKPKAPIEVSFTDVSVSIKVKR
ncbi:MAG: dihydroneopterin aldolase [Candidatus Nanopelagicaceae bacterium]|jgi:dihydroneopterin aldolase|nr:dihydroneopterin aldolase [Candidatus Nanopelagicaceae bacterium]